VRRPRPAGQDGHPHRAHRLAAHPRAAGRAARVAADRPPGTHPRGADMTRGDAEPTGTDEVHYDGGLQAAAAEGRVAQLPGGGPSAEVDSPFLPLVTGADGEPTRTPNGGEPAAPPRQAAPAEAESAPRADPTPVSGNGHGGVNGTRIEPVNRAPLGESTVDRDRQARVADRRPARHARPPEAPATGRGGRTALDRAPKPKRKDRDPAVEVAITEIAGHLTFTPNAVTAWYWLPEVRWAFRPDPEREALLSAISEQYAGLAGFRLHLRRTTRPFPADQWARVVDGNTPQPLATVDGAPAWSDHLVAAQRPLIALNHAEGHAYLGIP